ncbi:MAG: hypothetical protein PHN49_00285 [Candidatus Omnitrophica bacterium]|nr:hypothetical protein [Candidatus Omnitrophota bacterium]
MTGKELISTGLLDLIFDQMKIKRAWQNKITNYICKLFNSLLLGDKLTASKDPARRYIKKLERDFKKLSRIETHRQEINKLRQSIEIKKTVGKTYIDLFRKIQKRTIMKICSFSLSSTYYLFWNMRNAWKE